MIDKLKEKIINSLEKGSEDQNILFTLMVMNARMQSLEQIICSMGPDYQEIIERQYGINLQAAIDHINKCPKK